MIIIELNLILKLPSSVNSIYGRNKFGSTYLKKEGKEYKENAKKYIKEESDKQEWIKLGKEEYCYLDVIVYMNKKGRDADNLFKLIQDSITESNSVWEDDTFALSRTNRVYVDRSKPRVELKITPTDTIGIFENKEDYNEFKSKCEKCKRYTRNCSIHKNCLDNIIQDEIPKINGKWECLKYSKRK